MRVAIVSAYHHEPVETIRRCVDSVKAQTHPCDHFLVADGHPIAEIDYWGVEHVRLPKAHADYGDTPRLIGAVTAYAQGYDALCWLDADNWYEPDHVRFMLAAAQTNNARVVTATRNLYRPDGSFLAVCNESNGRDFNDTNCYLLTRDAMHIACRWGFKDKRLAAIGDRLVWAEITEQFPDRAHVSVPTVNYTTLIAAHYVQRNLPPPPGAKVILQITPEEGFKSVSWPEYLELMNRK